MKEINRLDFNCAKLYGRSTELDALLAAKKRISNADSGKTETILVHGDSGTGKSTLIRTALQEKDNGNNHNNNSSTYFVSGKFDQQQMSEPYSGISMAFTELCEIIISSNERDQISEAIKEAVGKEGSKVLMSVIPNLRTLIGDNAVVDNNNSDRNRSLTTASRTQEAMNQLIYVFRTFVRCVCTPLHPVVLFLDDLQWADCSSIQLIKALATDTESKHLLIVGSYRDNEVDKNHHLTSQMRDIEKERTVQRIHLNNLDEESVNQLISDLTHHDTATTRPLTDIVYRRTFGNIYFVNQFLRTLQDEELLCFSLSTYEWTWDLDRIQSETDLTENVVGVVANKIQKQCDKVQSVLKLAASISFMFSVDFLTELISQSEEKFMMSVQEQSCLCNSIINCTLFDNKENLMQLLDRAADEGLLDKLGNSSYKFAHDRVQQAAYSLIPAKRERELLHLRIGALVSQMNNFDTNHKLLFIAADQLNRGSAYIVDKDRREDLAKLNLQAGEKAMSLSAFVPAAAYLEAGIAMLDFDNNWGQRQYDLSLRMYTCLAEAESSIGNLTNSRLMVEEVLKNAQSLDDKLPVYFTLIITIISQGKLQDAMALILDVLKQLGEPFPTTVNSLHVIIARKKAKRLLHGRTDGDLLALPPMKDKYKIYVMKLFANLNLCMWQLDMNHGADLVAFRMIEATLRFGLCRQTADGFSFYGSSLISQGYIKEGYRFGSLAIKIAERFNAKGQTSPGVFVSVMHWQQPIQNLIMPLMDGYQALMKKGAIEGAFMYINAYFSSYYYSGLPLGPMIADLEQYGPQMLTYKQEYPFCLLLPVWQCSLNLTGRSGDPLQMDRGEAIDQLIPFENKHKIGRHSIWSFQMQLAYYFGNLELAEVLAGKLRHVTKTGVSFIVYARTFFFGLISLALAKKTKKRKYIQEAKSVIKKMKQWVKMGAVNCVHKLFLLQAEYASLDDGNSSKVKDVYNSARKAALLFGSEPLSEKGGFHNTDKVKEIYDGAIKAASQTGYNQDAALANELAGKYFLECGDGDWASFYLCRSYDLFNDWGATAKSDKLQNAYPLLITPSKRRRYSSSLLGRSRFNPKDALMHKGLSLIR